MADYTTEVVVDDLVFPEGPRWRGDRLWFSDQHDHLVRTVTPDGKLATVTEVAECPSGLGWQPDGTLLVVSMHDRKVLRYVDGQLHLHADLSGIAEHHCNDMVVDADGRAYVGNFGFDLDAGATPEFASLAIVEPDGTARVGPGKCKFPNGMVITPDGSTLVVAETTGSRLSAFDVQGGGDLTNRREFAPVPGFMPDGICLDAAGGIWMACPMSGRALRIEAGGRVTDEVRVTSGEAFACMLGGEDRRTLFVCVAPTFDPVQVRAARGGRIERCTVTIPGAGLP